MVKQAVAKRLRNGSNSWCLLVTLVARPGELQAVHAGGVEVWSSQRGRLRSGGWRFVGSADFARLALVMFDLW